MSPLFAGMAGLLVFASVWELAGFGPPAVARRFARRVNVDREALVPKLAGVVAGALAFAAIAPVAPGRPCRRVNWGSCSGWTRATSAACWRGSRTTA